VDPDGCVDRVHALYKRAQYYAVGVKAGKDSGKPFVPDWPRLASTDTAQKEIEGLMVRLCCLHLVKCSTFYHSIAKYWTAWVGNLWEKHMELAEQL
jgi:hypothetical protein